MKLILKSLLFLSLLTFSINPAFSQKKAKGKIKNAEIEVTGVCKMCKTRIENAALIKGVKLAEWDKESQKLKLVFDNRKVKLDKIHQAIADFGHDTDKIKAKDEAYKKLPKCCAYRDGVKVH